MTDTVTVRLSRSRHMPFSLSIENSCSLNTMLIFLFFSTAKKMMKTVVDVEAGPICIVLPERIHVSNKIKTLKRVDAIRYPVRLVLIHERSKIMSLPV